jgi:hypothetical protein
VPTLAQLLKAELAEREVRSVHRTLGCSALPYRIKTMRFPVYNELSGFNIAISEINEATVRQLHCSEVLWRGRRSLC